MAGTVDATEDADRAETPGGRVVIRGCVEPAAAPVRRRPGQDLEGVERQRPGRSTHLRHQLERESAYYYFASKDAIIGAYYGHVHDVHAVRCREALAAKPDLRGRLRVALHSKVDVLQGDRKLLRALFRYGGDPDHELSWFGPATAQRRRESIALFAEVLAGESLPADLRDAGPTLLWALHMGVLLFFVYDESPNQRRTRRLIDATVDLAVDLRRIVASPFLRPVRRRLLGLLGDAGLLPATASANA